MDILSKDDLKRFLKKTPEWEIEGKKICRTIEFDGFAEAVEFLNDVAEVAEDEGHHPDVDIRDGKVTLMLTTHDAGGVTETDIEVAQRLDNLID
ncbi:MAG: 4a-hydroxytetrahydrobiopterin dehydratase [Verrucomicrobiaceae bacterium]|nr:MAG: 4a-hydroxytetrahydrobiopterin dehydratase [Verrucomicrobiaceae bacterium]